MRRLHTLNTALALLGVLDGHRAPPRSREEFDEECRALDAKEHAARYPRVPGPADLERLAAAEAKRQRRAAKRKGGAK